MTREENLARQHRTPKSVENSLIDECRPYKGGRHYFGAIKMGWYDLTQMGWFKVWESIQNSRVKRGKYRQGGPG